MKKVIFLALGALFCTLVYAQNYNGPTNLTQTKTDNITIRGPATLKQVNTDSLTVYGPLQFTELEVKNDATIYGGVTHSQKGSFGNLFIKGLFQANDISCNSLKVFGFMDVDNMTVKQGTEIKGALKAKNSTFQDITAAGDKIMLEDSQVNNISMNLEKERIDNAQTIYLKGNTTVNGDIKFDSGKGVVVSEGSSVSIKGKIQGGTLQKSS